MKMTIVKGLYSNILLISVFLLFAFIQSCNTSKKVLSYDLVVEETVNEGVSARGLTMVGDSYLFAGVGGQASVYYFDSSKFVFIGARVLSDMEDVRDIACNSMGACFFINAGTTGKILAVAPSGREIPVYDTLGVFLDGVTFWNDTVGIAYGDPINGKFFLVKTEDMGRSWKALTPNSMPNALENEGGFAASGTGIQAVGDSTIYFGTGLGERVRLFKSTDRGMNWEVKDTPMITGDSHGIYSIYFWSETEGVIIGGSYIDSTLKKNSCLYTADGGETWETRNKGLAGYCSAVQGNANGDLLVATGRMGTFYSTNKGKEWELLTNSGYYSCMITETRIVLVGRNGKAAFYNYRISNS